MGHDELVIIGRLTGALVIGAMIGFERSFHGRPAGFRTHALVCLASALLMLVTVYQLHWMTEVPLDTIRADPTRMAQGIMTGIGFLGAGCYLQGRPHGARADDRGIHLDNVRDRHPCRHRILVSGNSWRDRGSARACCFSLCRGAAAERVLCASHAALLARPSDVRGGRAKIDSRPWIYGCQSVVAPDRRR